MVRVVEVWCGGGGRGDGDGGGDGELCVYQVDTADLVRQLGARLLNLLPLRCSPPSTLHECFAVAVCMDNGSAMVVAELSVVQAGLTLVPVSPEATRDEVDYKVHKTIPICAAVVDSAGSHGALAAMCREHGIPCLLIKAEAQQLQQLREEEEAKGCGALQSPSWSISDITAEGKSTSFNPNGDPHLAAVASPHACLEGAANDSGRHVSHVFFTSGSTGRPKACAVSRQTLLEAAENQQKTFGTGTHDVIFLGSTITFDPSLCDIFTAATANAIVAVAPRRLMLTRLPECLRLTGATHMCTTPTLVQSYARNDMRPATVPSLRTLALGGEPMMAETAAIWGRSSAHSTCRLFNVYGVTECCGYQSALEVHGSARHKRAQRAQGTALHRLVGLDMGSARLFLVRNYKHIQALAEAVAEKAPTSRTRQGSEPRSPQLHLNAGTVDVVQKRDSRADGKRMRDAGEVWIAGPQMGLGYVAREPSTASCAAKQCKATGTDPNSQHSRFPVRLAVQPHPAFTDLEGVGRVYRTGDLARLPRPVSGDDAGAGDGHASPAAHEKLMSGNLWRRNHHHHQHQQQGECGAARGFELLGRLDWQVKLLGRRVDLCGLEAQYHQHLRSVVKTAVATAAKGRLVCWVTLLSSDGVEGHGGGTDESGEAKGEKSSCPTLGKEACSSSDQVGESSSSVGHSNDPDHNVADTGKGAPPHAATTLPTFTAAAAAECCAHGAALHAPAHTWPTSSSPASACAYCCGKCELLQAACRLALRTHLPAHLVPHAVVCVDVLPTTSSGKLARKRLWRLQNQLLSALPRQPSRQQQHQQQQQLGSTATPHDTTTALHEPCALSPLQAVIAGALSQHLPVPMTQEHDTFVRLGGDSLQAVRAVYTLLAAVRGRSRTSQHSGRCGEAGSMGSDSNDNRHSKRDTGHGNDHSNTGGGGGAATDVGVFAERAAISPALVLAATLAELERAVLGAFPGLRDEEESTAQTDEDKSADHHVRHPNDSDHARDVSGQGHRSPGSDNSRLQANTEAQRLCVRAAEQDGVVTMRLLLAHARPPLHLLGSGELATAYRVACTQGSAGVVRLLNTDDMATAAASSTFTAATSQRVSLHMAFASGSEATVRAVLAHPSCVPAVALRPDGDGMTPLHHAARGGAGTRLLRLLMDLPCRNSTGGRKHGGNTGRRGGKGGKGAKTAAQTVGSLCLHARDKWGRTPLHWAVVNGHRTATCALLEAGADAALADAAGETPLQIAERRAQCRAADRGGLRPSVFGDIATLLGGSGKTVKLAAA